MKNMPKTLVKTVCLSIALLGATAVVTTVTMPDVAYAKSSKSKGKAKGSSNKPAHAAAKAKKPYQGGNAIAVATGLHPSQLGNLNAWNNNSGNLNPNSMPGKIAEYERLVVDGYIIEQANLLLQADIDAAALIDGDFDGNPDYATSATTCVDAGGADYACDQYDIATIFPNGDPSLDLDPTNDALKSDYDALLAANSALASLADPANPTYDPTVEQGYMDSIANKDQSSNYDALRDAVIADYLATNP